MITIPHKITQATTILVRNTFRSNTEQAALLQNSYRYRAGTRTELLLQLIECSYKIRLTTHNRTRTKTCTSHLPLSIHTEHVLEHNLTEFVPSTRTEHLLDSHTTRRESTTDVALKITQHSCITCTNSTGCTTSVNSFTVYHLLDMFT